MLRWLDVRARPATAAGEAWRATRPRWVPRSHEMSQFANSVPWPLRDFLWWKSTTSRDGVLRYQRKELDDSNSEVVGENEEVLEGGFAVAVEITAGECAIRCKPKVGRDDEKVVERDGAVPSRVAR